MIIVSKTPLRVSFFGGGTDYPEYFEHDRGAVIGMTINQHIYTSCLQLRTFLDYKYRLSYSKLETCNAISEIDHPVVKAVLNAYKVTKPLHISTTADLPAQTGLGSSSAFTVGFINLIATLCHKPLNKIDLAEKAVYFERGVLQEHVGVQDQYHAAFGGLNRFDFYKSRTKVLPIQMHAQCQQKIMESMVLVYTGIQRSASEVLKEQMTNTKERTISKQLNHLLDLADYALEVLEHKDPDYMLKEFGRMLDEGWQTKRSLSSKISTDHIDDIYSMAVKHGALGGKLCGAGGGGFFFLLIPKERQKEFAQAIAPLAVIPISIDTSGSTIIYRDYNISDFAFESMANSEIEI